jgi:YD repeat-containing protein
VLAARPKLAQADVQYVYDENGRLAGVIDPSGNAAQYNYDAAGNDKCTRRAFEPDSLRGCRERQGR